MKARIRSVVRDAVRKLEINDGDVVLIRFDTILGQKDNFHAFTQILGRTGREKCIVAVVESFDDLTALSEDEMRELGWVRLEEEDEG